jgi:hypothetical protein
MIMYQPWVRANLFRAIATTIISCLGLYAGTLSAQTVPADLLDVSLEDLFSANVIEDDVAKNRWHLSYSYGRSTFDEYRNGSDRLTYDDVLWSGPGEVKTRENFPVVPTKITQEVHSVLLAYDVNDRLGVRLLVPFIEQSTDHISIVPNYDDFNISSDGVGDVVAMAEYSLGATLNSAWRVIGGVSIPTGSIDEEGDTPRAPGNQQLPYTMQIGSGTWDIPLGLVYEKYGEQFSWGAEVQGKVRLGENDRDYRLGHRLGAAVWTSVLTNSGFRPGVRLGYSWQDEIDGEDASLSIPNPAFPYPAPVTDPSAFGGQQIDLSVYVDFPIAASWSGRIGYTKPIWFDLNGPQSAQNYHLAFTLTTGF